MVGTKTTGDGQVLRNSAAAATVTRVRMVYALLPSVTGGDRFRRGRRFGAGRSLRGFDNNLLHGNRLGGHDDRSCGGLGRFDRLGFRCRSGSGHGLAEQLFLNEGVFARAAFGVEDGENKGECEKTMPSQTVNF